MLNNKIIKEYNLKCNKYFTYDKINKYKISFNTNNQIKYIILNNNLWCKFKIICSMTNKEILWANNMILIENEFLSKIKAPTDLLNNNIKINFIKIEEYIIKNLQEDNIGIIKNTIGNLTIYYEINKIIKS
jgi:hypothetical protein